MKKKFINLCNKITLRNAYRAVEVIWDRLRGVDFSGTLEFVDLGYEPDPDHRSEPTGTLGLHRLMKKLKIRKDDAIVDIGCGKGSAMRVIRKQAFARISGIENAEKIANIAKSNFDKLKADNCEVFNQDAADFSDYGDYNFFYLFNPFSQGLMEKVILKIEDAIKDKKQEVIIIYLNPKCDAAILKSGKFTKIQESRIEWSKVYLYSNFPAEKSRISIDQIGSLQRGLPRWPFE
jgi:precorrin-6B methylase 2